jgi:hypothetical protein
MTRRVLAVLLAGLPLTTAGAQRLAVTGRVVDERGAPIPRVNVLVARHGRFVADDSGAFTFRLPEGAARIELRRLGFHPTSTQFVIRRDTSVTFTMVAVPRDLPEHRIVATVDDGLSRRGFYDRMRDADRGLVTGYFVTPEDIEARRAFRTSQMIEHVPGVKMLGIGGNNVQPVGMNDCLMSVYVDGVRVRLANDSSVRRGSNGMSIERSRHANARHSAKITPGGTLDDIVGINSVTGIEIYPRGTRAPAMFQTLNGTCGIIAVWTR